MIEQILVGIFAGVMGILIAMAVALAGLKTLTWLLRRSV